MERSWFRRVLADEVAPPHRPGPNPGGFDAAVRIWHEECVRSRATAGAAGSLDITGSPGDEVVSLRYVLTHMIEEYARHNGQADLARERVDGTTGE
ncbi:DUF664 domain-containing protein [Streptomyces pulveraceus]|uniref:DUF664 domain-containing protein n=1 Tax=Streptomyces pulveraceus TaxID=68258 RepID=A0ABW1GKC4_9ACTN